MFKILILISALIFSLGHAWAKVEARWFTVAAVLIEDGETRLFFDPMFTRAKWQHWLNFSELRSDEALVSSVLQDHKIEKIDAVFASHSHFDHVIDAPMISKLTGATFYVDKHSEIIAKAYKDPKIITQRIENMEPIKVGKFTITPMKKVHSHIRALGINYMKGSVQNDFNFGFYDYYDGETWFYLIDHPSGKILIDQGAQTFINTVESFTSKIDVLIQGVANRESDDVILKGYADVFKASTFIPTHFDNFLFGFDPKGTYSLLPGVRIDELMEKMKKTHPDKKLLLPKYAEKIEILK